MNQNRPSEHPPEHVHDDEICATCEAWYANDPYADFVQCESCEEWYSKSVGHHGECRPYNHRPAEDDIEPF